MGDITRNLSRYEFACRCGCGLSDPHPRLVFGIQGVVDACGAAVVIITSGTRCEVHNAYLVRTSRASNNSKHMVWLPSNYSQAADCVFRGVLLSSALAAARAHPEFSKGGIGLYVGNTPRLHLDVRGVKARWGVVDGDPVSFGEALAELHRREDVS